MEGPIFILWQAKRTEAWYRISEQEVGELLAKDNQAIERVGGRNIIACDSRWGSAHWEWFGIDEMPDIDAHLAHVAALEEIQMFRYYDIEFTLASGISANA